MVAMQFAAEASGPCRPRPPSAAFLKAYPGENDLMAAADQPIRNPHRPPHPTTAFTFHCH
jgi:hypothetical protein